jgi:protein gp37
MQGIDKHLAHEARKLGALSDERYAQTEAEVRAALTSAAAKVVKSITLPKKETAESEAEIEITIPQWKAMSAAEREKYLDPSSFPSDAKLNPQDEADGTDYCQRSYSTVVGCKHPCQIYCWAHDVTLRFPNTYRHGFEPVFRPRMLGAPRNTSVPAEAEFDGRFKNVSSNFMSDMFGRWIPAPWIEATLAVEGADPRWNFLHLTKFPGRLLEFDIPPNCWMGTTVDLQARVANAEAAFAQLREKYHDAIFWLSIEPMLEPIKFTRLYLFNWIVIGGAARSTRTPEWRPPHRAIMDLIAQADAVGCKVFEKTNLYGNRIIELPFDAPIKNDYPQVAPEVFHYLNPRRRRRVDDDPGGAP